MRNSSLGDLDMSEITAEQVLKALKTIKDPDQEQEHCRFRHDFWSSIKRWPRRIRN